MNLPLKCGFRLPELKPDRTANLLSSSAGRFGLQDDRLLWELPLQNFKTEWHHINDRAASLVLAALPPVSAR